MSIELVETELQRVASVVTSIASSHGLRASFEPSDSLVDGGFTSMAMVDLMLAVESKFDMMIPDRELSASNFSSIQSLVLLIRRLRDINSSPDRKSHENNVLEAAMLMEN